VGSRDLYITGQDWKVLSPGRVLAVVCCETTQPNTPCSGRFFHTLIQLWKGFTFNWTQFWICCAENITYTLIGVLQITDIKKTWQMPMNNNNNNNETRWSFCTFALLNMQSLRHWNYRQMVHTHAQASVWRGRCYSVVESSSTHRQRSYSKFIHLVVCLATGPKSHPKRALHIVRSRASSFKWEYPLLSLRSSSSFLRLLPHLPVTSIPPFIFPSLTRCRRQFLSKITADRPDITTKNKKKERRYMHTDRCGNTRRLKHVL